MNFLNLGAANIKILPAYYVPNNYFSFFLQNPSHILNYISYTIEV